MKKAFLLFGILLGCTTEKVKFIETDITPVSKNKKTNLQKNLKIKKPLTRSKIQKPGKDNSIKDFSFGNDKDYQSDLYRQGRKARFSGGYDSPW